ncbi:hypothetical protein CALCODRAFT_540535 [Calocera cornea HHB12733]|uniref:Uncharacterized protein n=1 Tax=Calocera cornea HHB12733 TaxID=1353952 RepID=A0A165GEY4_9BASI|nr:hypothetical protein CALCODRAFT_540535 [Calocera cornea HHB12733]
MASSTPLAMLPLPGRPPTLPVAAHRSRYMTSREDLVRSTEHDLEPDKPGGPLPIGNRLSWPHLHVINVGFLDDHRQNLCWHLRACITLRTPANSDYPGQLLYGMFPLSDVDQYLILLVKLDFLLNQRIRDRIPLAAPVSPIHFPAGHVPEFLPARRVRTKFMKRIWRLPNELDNNEPEDPPEEDILVVNQYTPGPNPPSSQSTPSSPRSSSDRSPSPTIHITPELRNAAWFQNFMQAKVLRDELLVGERFREDDQAQKERHKKFSEDIDQLVSNQPPIQMNRAMFDGLLTGRLPLVVRPGAQEVYAAAHPMPTISDLNYARESQETRLNNLVLYFRGEGLPFALPFIRELLDDCEVLGEMFHEEANRLLGKLGRVPDGGSPARPDDLDKCKRMDDAYTYMTTAAHADYVNRTETLRKGQLLVMLLQNKRMQDSYAELKFPWYKLTSAAQEAYDLLEFAMQAQDFDWRRVPPNQSVKLRALLKEAMPNDMPDHPWTGGRDSFAGFTF